MIDSTSLSTARAAYDAVAARYAKLYRAELDRLPLDRALIGAFAELVQAAGGGPVADLGCGPGRITALLHSLGVDAFGVDLSPEMIAQARLAHPDLRFDVGSMAALELRDGALGGLLAWYSVIHTPPEQLPQIFAEFHRVLAPGGHVLLAFFASDDPARPAQEFDHKVTAAYRLLPDHVAGLLGGAGLVEIARLVREPGENERFQRGHILARKPDEA